MIISFTKLSDTSHKVAITRADQSTDSVQLESRSYLRHDFAHLAVELSLPLHNGFWGSVAGGEPLTESSVKGAEIMLAENLAVRVQGLMRENAAKDRYVETLCSYKPELISPEQAFAIYEQARTIQGHWRATAYGETMTLTWNSSDKQS